LISSRSSMTCGSYSSSSGICMHRCITHTSAEAAVPFAVAATAAAAAQAGTHCHVLTVRALAPCSPTAAPAADSLASSRVSTIPGPS
jgi:hypothetical protein